jgi:antitoxin ParD1/3/4
MEITLTAAEERLIHEKVQSGQFDSADEVVKAALYLLGHEDRRTQRKLAVLRAKIDVGMHELLRGEGIPGPIAVEQARAEFHNSTRDERLAALRREIQKGINDLDNGRYSTKDEAFARIRARRGL